MIAALRPTKGLLVSRLLVLLALLAALLAFPAGASADPSDYVTPIFGVTTGKGGLLVADSGQGIVRIPVRTGVAALWAPLPGVVDVDESDELPVWAITSGSTDNMRVWRVTPKRQDRIANLFAFEKKNNPHPAVVESNPFDIENVSNGRAVVADAAGNDLIRVRPNGKLGLIAVLPDELVPTRNAKRLFGCPNPPPDFAFVCDLPPMIPAEPVPTSVVVKPSGYYVAELKGFPGPRHQSRIWRIDRDARNVDCATSPKCEVVVDGLTSVVDLDWYKNKLYAAQLDDGSFLAFETGQGIGGSVRECSPISGECKKVVSGQPILTSITIRQNNGSIWGATNALIPGQADVVRLRGAQ